ncbi:MAG: hypothetical protein ACI376_08960 [Candidatus Bruticola sp.]
MWGQNLENSRIKRFRSVFTIVLAAVQISLLFYVLLYFTIFADESKTELEYGADDHSSYIACAESELVNTASVLTGSQFVGRFEQNPLSFNLNYTDGNMIWFLFKRGQLQNCPLLNWPDKYVHVKENNRRQLQQAVTDGIINFLYDTGTSVSIGNAWSRFVVETLNGSPFMPWQKKLDFIIVSNINLRGGFNFINNLNKNIVYLCANTDVEDFCNHTSLYVKDEPQIISVPPGVHQLFLGVWAVVVPNEEKLFDLNLLVRRLDNSLVLFCGAGSGSFRENFRIIEEELHEVPSLLIVNFDEKVWESGTHTNSTLKQFATDYKHLEVKMCGGVSFSEYEILRDAFGDRVSCSKLGERISL